MRLCKYCGAEIDWLRDENGHNFPVEPDPVLIIEAERGDTFYTDEGQVLTGWEARPDEVRTREQRMNAECGFIPHNRVCPALRSRR